MLAAYEALHPETKYESTLHKGSGRQLGDPEDRAPRFTADTAARTGQSERSVQRSPDYLALRGAPLCRDAEGAKLDRSGKWASMPRDPPHQSAFLTLTPARPAVLGDELDAASVDRPDLESFNTLIPHRGKGFLQRVLVRREPVIPYGRGAGAIHNFERPGLFPFQSVDADLKSLAIENDGLR